MVALALVIAMTAAILRCSRPTAGILGGDRPKPRFRDTSTLENRDVDTIVLCALLPVSTTATSDKRSVRQRPAESGDAFRKQFSQVSDSIDKIDVLDANIEHRCCSAPCEHLPAAAAVRCKGISSVAFPARWVL